MPLKSDMSINVAKFAPQNYSSQTTKLNEHLADILSNGPKWYEIGAAKYREMRNAGQTPIPKPKLSPDALDIEIPSRDCERTIPCRLVFPSWRKGTEDRRKVKSIAMLIHGGGWVLGDQHSADGLLQNYADAGDLAVISVGYRLAPEYPFPCGPNDCIDVGEYLVRHAERVYGSSLKFIGGESAGAHLTLLTAFHLLKTHPTLTLSGLILHCGIYDLTLLPHCRNSNSPRPILLNHDMMRKFTDAFLGPELRDNEEEKKKACVSPFYENLTGEGLRGRLPAALFLVGTEDPLLDDSVGMCGRWVVGGGEGCLRVYGGAPHAVFWGVAGVDNEGGEEGVEGVNGKEGEGDVNENEDEVAKEEGGEKKDVEGDGKGIGKGDGNKVVGKKRDAEGNIKNSVEVKGEVKVKEKQKKGGSGVKYKVAEEALRDSMKWIEEMSNL